MKRNIASVVSLGASALLLAAFSTSAPRASQQSNESSRLLTPSDCSAFLKSHSAATATVTKSYVMVSVAGPNEAMYTPSQVKSMHPTSGEVMVRGTMSKASGSSMPMGTGSIMRHIEVHICSKATGKALTGVRPLMGIRDLTKGSMKSSMPVAEMQGLDRNPADTHYGNNVTVVPGDRYEVRTIAGGQTGRFQFTAPKTRSKA
jgi:hypothetical protein